VLAHTAYMSILEINIDSLWANDHMKSTKKHKRSATQLSSGASRIEASPVFASDIKNISAPANAQSTQQISNPPITIRADTNPNQRFLNQLLRERPDIDPEFLYKCVISEEKYTEKYKDIASSGMHAAEHYFTYGHAESRELCRPGLLNHDKNFNITSQTTLFLSSAELRDGSFIYRCLFQSLDYKKNLVYSGKTEILKLVRAVFNCKEIIFSRPERTETAFYLIELAKNIGVKVILDYDDLLLPEHAEYLGHVRSSDGTSVEAARKSLINKSAFLLYADAFHCSTPQIAKGLTNLGKPIKIVKNRIMASMVAREDLSWDRLSTLGKRRIKLLYLSGTATHKKDYSIVHGTLLKLAQEFPNEFEITYLGNTGGNPSPLALYNDHVKVIPRVSLKEMYDVISQHDLALAPLEDTIFNNAKSNIKYIECGSQAVPIIASPLAEFRDVISHGSNGWLCTKQSDWYEQIKYIIQNPTVLRNVALAARSDVLQKFTVQD
jgi:glycosyltransferase involved in cell wall biosynthesis